MSNPHDPGHGSSPAAWTAVVIMLIGIIAGTLFFWLDMPAYVIASTALLAVGPIVGAVMARAGYGVNSSRS